MNNNDGVWAFIGSGPNSVRIAGIIFPTLEAAKEYLEGYGLALDHDNYVLFGEWGDHADEAFEHTYPENVRVDDVPYTPGAEDIFTYADIFFNGYYGGCGECHAVRLRHIPFGKPFVGFDLD